MENNEKNQESAIKKIWNKILTFLIINAFLLIKIGLGILSLFISFFFLEKMFPSLVQVMNYAITEKTVTQMVSGHHYNQAIYLLEHKENLIASSENFHELRYPLYDCYYKVGEFMKAEREIRIMEDSARQKMEKTNDERLDYASECFLFMLTKRDRLKIYEKIGDISKIQSVTQEIKALYNTVESLGIPYLEEELPEEFSIHELTVTVRFDIIKADYYNNPQQAMDSLNNMISEIYHQKKYNQGFKLRMMNQMLKWLIENHHTIRARYVLEMALLLTDHMPKKKELYEPLGELSDYCWALHDIPNARRMLHYYNLYINETCTGEDMEYYLSKARFFKMLEYENKTEELEDMVCECCDGIKQHILNNMAGMTSEQREYFVEIMMVPFGEAERLLNRTHSPRLEKICFENKCFTKGLLMRSSLLVDNAVKSLGDSSLSVSYQNYIQLRQELTARQYISGPGNYIRKKELESQISETEAMISERCEEFARARRYDYSLSHISETLDSGEAMVMFSDNGDCISAYIVTHQGLKYKVISEGKDFAEAIHKYPNLYANEDLTHMIWDGILSEANNAATIYYIPDGILNNISMGALAINDNTVLNDKANLYLLSSPTTLEQAKAEPAIYLSQSEISLWGGVFYSDGDSVYVPDMDCSIRRGRQLRYLPGSLSEVLDIKYLMDSIGARTHLYTNNSATEKSFVSRSGKSDQILHVSTHAFFQENDVNSLNYNPMHNCGLFFYNSNRFWVNDSTNTNILGEDGILRSEEIETCDFSRCRIAVLSACETGKGESSSAEGVYGLQRAFKLAGVDMILMSLWNVDDASTRDLMVSFYHHLSRCNNPFQALKSAQTDIRNQGKDVYYWGGFVLMR